MTDLPPAESASYAAYTQRCNADYRHAINLVTTGCERELIAALPDYVEPIRIALGAIRYALHYSPHNRPDMSGYITPKQARDILEGIGSVQPEDLQALVLQFMEPAPCKPHDQATYWPINKGHEQHLEDCVWGLVIGIERAWFAYDRGGCLHWSLAGRDLYAAGAAPLFVESGTGQGAFAF